MSTQTTTDIRTAILRAADHIEAHPELYDFCLCNVPGKYSPAGCMLAWTAYFMGYQPGDCGQGLSKQMLGVDSVEFYNRTHGFGSRMEPGNAVRYLRAYADKYHPAPRQSTPDWQQVAECLAHGPRLPEVEA